MPGPLGAGKTAESQVLSVLLPVQRLLLGTAAGAMHLRWPWGHAASFFAPLPGFPPKNEEGKVR